MTVENSMELPMELPMEATLASKGYAKRSDVMGSRDLSVSS